MNKIIQSLVKELVQIEVSGKKILKGVLIDLGTDLMVIFNGTDYLYIPIHHVHSFRAIQKNEFEKIVPTESSSNQFERYSEDLTLKTALHQATGKYSEIYLIDDQPLHGCITQVMADYFEFYSPVYKTMYISTNHLKWLIPYVSNEGPYRLDSTYVKPLVQAPLENTFNAQIEKFKFKMGVFNIGGSKSHVGKIINVEKQIVELEKAREIKNFLNINHLKTFHEV
ncbi:hypothetical protein SAMN05518871_101305 [Psychrobacillus sp. OK028]|uniref:hypothetical protein n=1 Tax=Psychrobacillus sp. OK028 TaxID=1884359 RepID=UPI0008892443|nr:hypothetical protein [Psychrobacillus sp. OK028]SDM46972.1 hypothetical protein SAMN05518871_101305 [Psychrobacillus sp. OK028]